MLDKIVKLLKEFELSDWKLKEQTVESQEYFFVKRALDLGRTKKVKHFELTVYKDFSRDGEEYRGSSTVDLSPLMEEGELRKSIEGACFAAEFVKNPPYPLVKPYKRVHGVQECDLSKLALNTLEAVFKSTAEGEAWLNSLEIFLSERKERILNSNGLDVSYNHCGTYIETIVTARGAEEVELYDRYLISLPEFESIRRRITSLLQRALNRSRAIPTPSIEDLPVILTGEPAKEAMRYYLEQASAKLKYDRITQVEPGSSIQAGEAGDRIDLNLVPELEGSYFSAPVDEDGFPLEKVDLIKEGVLLRNWGNLRYSHYLGIEPTGSALNFSVSPGSLTDEEMHLSPNFEVTDFSAVEVDETTGDFGGEIRLGWYFDGKERVPITGGSVTGNLRNMKSLYLSREVKLEENYYGPRSIMIEGFRISGE